MKVPFLDLKREYLAIKQEIQQKILEALERGEYCYGVETKRFEKSFARLVGCRYCLGTNSGTDSLIIALKALGIGTGDEVITTPFTFMATAEAIINVGARPVFVDVEEATMNLDINKIEQAITLKTKAIIPVHLYGICVDMDPLLKIAKRHNLFIIEDAAHAKGSLYKGKPAGSLGDIGCFSLYPSKTLGAYGNAGAVVTNNKLLAEKMRMISNHGRGENWDIHQIVGLTGTIDNIQAAILNVKLKYLEKRMRKIRKIAEGYSLAFRNLSIRIPGIPSYCRPSFYVYTIRTEKRSGLREFLSKNGIETRIYYLFPLHLQPSLKFLGYKKSDFPAAERAARSVLSLPLYSEMTGKEINYVIKKVKDFEGK